MQHMSILRKSFLLSSTALCFLSINSVLSSQNYKENLQLSTSAATQKKIATKEEFLDFLALHQLPPKEIKHDMPKCLENFLNTSNDKNFSKKTVKTIKQFQSLEIEFSLICEVYLHTYHQQLRLSSNKKYVNGLFINYRNDFDEFRSQSNPHYIYLQSLIDIYFTKRKIIFPDLNPQENLPFFISSCKNTGDLKEILKIGVFKDENGYNPMLIHPQDPYDINIIHYGKQVSPKKMFVYTYGELVLDSGIFLSKTPTSVKLTFYNGEHSDNPFSCKKETLHFVADSLRKRILEEILTQGQNDQYFFLIPTTTQEKNLVEFLLLENLTADNQNQITEKKGLLQLENGKDKSSNSLPIVPYTDYSASFLIEEMASSKNENDSFLALLKSEAENNFDASFHQPTQLFEKGNFKEESKEETEQPIKKNKVKTKGKAFKNGKGKKTAQSHQATSTQPSKKSQKGHQAKVKAMKEQVKQEGRLKFKSVLKLLNDIYKSASSEKLENLKNSIAKGSHHGLHLEEGKGLTIVRKHGTGDLTLPAKTVNNLTSSLIDILIGNEKD